METMNILFKNATIICMDSEEEVLQNTDLGISNGKIVFLGKSNQNFEAKRIIDCKNKVIIPGLYNCHTHTPMALLRGYDNDKSLHEWLYNSIFPAEDYFRKVEKSTYIGAMLSIADMIESGTVAFSDMYFKLPDIAQAVQDSGIKANLCNPIIKNNNMPFVLKEDLSFLETSEVREKYSSYSNIKVNIGIHAEYTTDADIWKQVVDYAQQETFALQIHISETQYEHEECKKKYGLTPIQVFNEYGLLNIQTTAAHGVWLEKEDIDILKCKNVTIVNNPISNLKLASGIAPIKELLEEGINVALGTDGMASNNSNDLFEEMKIASILQKNRCKDTRVLPAKEILKIATVNGALAQGRENESGKIKVGYDADLVLLDFNSTRQTACYDPIANIVYSSSGKDVYMTMCKGKILYENGEHKTIDIEKLLFEAKKMISNFKYQYNTDVDLWKTKR